MLVPPTHGLRKENYMIIIRLNTNVISNPGLPSKSGVYPILGVAPAKSLSCWLSMVQNGHLSLMLFGPRSVVAFGCSYG